MAVGVKTVLGDPILVGMGEFTTQFSTFFSGWIGMFTEGMSLFLCSEQRYVARPVALATPKLGWNPQTWWVFLCRDLGVAQN